ncbi:MAG: TonB family protein, partial [Myxococcaceae bacterium]
MAQDTPSLTPPEVIERTDALYPPDALAAKREAVVELNVTVGTSGEVTEVTVAKSGGTEFDTSAVDAVRSWKFRPARRGDIAVPSRIRIPFRFALPSGEPAARAGATGISMAGGASPPAPSPVTVRPENESAQGTRLEATPDAGLPDLGDAVDVTVRGKKAPPPRATSDFVIDRETLAAAPRQSAADLLSSAPGVYISRPEGEAVAHEVFLRGFDAEHGQDIEFTSGPVPLNQPSHIHGQGYADLNVIIPETVRSLRVTEGVYDPRQGDFAVAGSADFDLGVAARGTTLSTSAGSFGTFRQLVLWAPEGQPEETFGAVAIRRSNGFGANRGSLSGTATGQYAFELPAGVHGLVHVAATGARAGLAGVLRLEDIESGRVGFYDSYPDPTANSQSAFSSRTQAALTLERASPDGARTSFAAWLLLADFRLRENFTGYTQRSQQHPDWVGRGDLIEQENHDFALGARFSQRTRRYTLLPEVSGNLEFGLSSRTDDIDQAQNLLQAPQNETWDRRVDATVRGSDLGVYADADLRLTRYVRLRGGARADVLHYDINDRLGNFIPIFDRQSHIVGFRRTALGVAAGPRATL